MPLKIAVQMDPIDDIDIAGDSTFALLLEAQARGHAIFCYLHDDLSQLGAEVYAWGSDLEVRDRPGDHFTAGERYRASIAAFDVVLMRQDPPFDMAYITATHLLEQVHPETLVVNDPGEVRNAPEKMFVMHYPELMPPTLITRDSGEVKRFRREHGEIIIKPLYGNGGEGVFKLGRDDENLNSLLELFQNSFREPFMVQKYLPAVRAGDKRIILVDGVIAGAINRIPAKGDVRSNMHVGGTPLATELTERDREICAAIGPELKRRGMIFTGIDVIGDVLTEINVTSPTGIREVKRFGGADIAALIWDAIEARR